MGVFDFLRGKKSQRIQPVMARQTVGKVHRRSYEAAKNRPDLNGWTLQNPGPNALMGDLAPLRARSRDRVRNDSVGNSAITKLTAGIIGENGLTPRWSTVPESIRDEAKSLWDQWTNAVDTTGKLSFHAAQYLAVRGMIESGDSLFRKIPLTIAETRQFSTGVPLALQLLESDYLVNDTNTSGNDRIVGGVVLNARGRCSAYRLYRNHPNDSVMANRDLWSFDDIPANEIAHLYLPIRPGQVRGVPHLHAVLTRIFGIHDFLDADLVRRRAQATLAGLIRNAPIPPNLSEVGDEETDGPQGALGSVARDAYGNVMETIVPGTWTYVDGSEDVTFTTPTGQSDLPQTMQMFLRMVGAGTGLTYESISGDMSQTNYSSYRAGRIDSELILSGIRKMGVLPVVNMLWQWWRDAAIVINPAMAQLPTIMVWSQPVTPSVEPQKDATAAKTRVDAGFSSISEEIEAMGKDPADVIARRNEDEKNFAVDKPGATWQGEKA